MILNLDSIIFISFLVINLIVGLFYSRGVKTVSEFAIGNRDFTTGTITTTIISTYIGAGFITAALTESYRQGLYFIIPVLGEPLALVVTGYFLVPRMTEFLGQTSVAEAMGSLYGNIVQKITALCGLFIGVGIVALQIKVSFSIMQLFFGISSFYASTLSAVIVIIYSSLGGIKAVTFTDILQFCTFGIIVPIICLSIWQTSDMTQVVNTISNSDLFDLKQILSLHNPRFTALICLFLYFVIPSIDPAYFQRISMAKNAIQAKKSFIIAGFVSLMMLLVVCWMSILLLASNPNLNPNNLLTHILENYTYPGLKGLAAIGIMAAIMSTADSYLNSASILFAQNIFKQFGDNKKKLSILRLISITIGIFAYILAMKAESLFQILVMTLSLYMPIVSVPLLLAVFGIRSSTKVVLIGMSAGIVTVLSWSNLYSYAQIGGFNSEVIEQTNEAIPGMLANLIVFMIAHAIYGKPNNKDDQKISLSNCNDKKKFLNLTCDIKNFNLKQFYNKNFSKHEYFYGLAGIFTSFTVFLEGYLINNTSNSNISLFYFIYHSSLIASFLLVILPLLSATYKNQNVIFALKIFLVPYILIFTPLCLAIINKFGYVNIVTLILSIISFAFIAKRQIALIILILTSLASVSFCNIMMGFNVFDSHYISSELQFKIIYALLSLSMVFLGFIKPAQEAEEISEEKIDHLTGTIKDQDDQILELSNLKQIFLRNLQHETNTPITGIYSMSQALHDCYDKLTDEQRKKSINTIVTSSERLISYANNLIDISKLSSQTYHFKLYKVNLSRLLDEVIRKCKKLYINTQDEENIEINISIQPNISTNCDEYYMRRIFENLIINAIQYCKKGKIEVILKKVKNDVQFIIKDSGIGIPKEELLTIFEPFVTSSRTTTPAGGRGVGLSVAKAAAEAHDASLVVGSNGKKGSVFTLTMPIRA